MLSAQSQNPTFSSKVEAVRVDVLVTEDGKPVRGLRAADFEILDNGVRQTVDIVELRGTAAERRLHLRPERQHRRRAPR